METLLQRIKPHLLGETYAAQHPDAGPHSLLEVPIGEEGQFEIDIAWASTEEV